MDAKKLVELTKPELIPSIKIGSHVFGIDDWVVVYEYEGRLIMDLGEQDHWLVGMDLETFEVDEKMDDSLYLGEMYEITAKDIFEEMNRVS